MVGVGSFALIISSLVVLLYRADVPADMESETAISTDEPREAS
jgi:hypothetical protein